MILIKFHSDLLAKPVISAEYEGMIYITLGIQLGVAFLEALKMVCWLDTPLPAVL
jgi:hypothetical protein